MKYVSTLTTFDQLCEYYASYIVDEEPDMNQCAGNKCAGNKCAGRNLYEIGGETEWIRDAMYQYNKLGFMTWTSQPGDVSSRNPIFKSVYHRLHHLTEGIIYCKRKQRALVRGYMEREKAKL